MSGIDTLPLKVLALAFYRRHAMMLGLLALFLVGLVRPGYLLFTGMFLRSLLLNTTHALAVGAIAFCWAMYSGFRLMRYLREPSLSFLLVVGARGPFRIFWIAFQNMFCAGFLGYLYLGLLSYHAFTLGFWDAWLYSGAAAIGLLSMSLWMRHRLARPLGPRAGTRWMPSFRLGMLRMLWECLWREHFAVLGIVKAFSLLFILLMVSAGFEEVLPQIAALAFTVSGLMQGALPLFIRQSEDSNMLWLRALPIPWWKRMGAHLAMHLALQIPELLLLSLALWTQQASIVYLFWYLASVMGIHALNLGLTYLPEMKPQDFLRLQFAIFIMSFLALVFALPLAWIHVALGGLGIGICGLRTFLVDDNLGGRK